MERYGILSIIGIIGAGIAEIFGGWTGAMTTLCVFMLVDYVTGLMCAGIFKKSHHTSDGGLESRAGYKGLARKFAVLLVVLIARRLDLLLGIDYVMNCVIISYVVNEAISICENVGLMGVPLPKVITDAITLLSRKAEKEVE